MIGRQKRMRVVFIDGIPIQSATLDAGDTGIKKEDPTVNPAALKELEPRALFDKYDADGSGGIDFDEFKVLLADLQIILSEPKALAYFKRCDKMRRGHISFEEFRLALYTCDPKNPNRTMGFAPGQSLSPKDLFDMFDRDEEGAIDRATFIEVLEFLGHKLPLDRVEGIFATHEDPETEMMPYYQFKKAWLSLVDVRAELRNRHEKFNRFLPESVLMKKLEVIINEEEKLEARMLLEAATTLDEERIAAYRRWLIVEAVTLSKLVLSEAIDAAGQVYMFGKGPFGRYDGEPIDPDFVEFMDYEIVRDLWTARVRPNPDALEYDLKLLAQGKGKSGESEEEDDRGDKGDSDSEDPDPASVHQVTQTVRSTDNSIPPGLTRAKMTLIAGARAFSGRQVSLIPTFLWGKRVRKVSLGPSVAYALTDSGEVFCWGGNKKRWRYFYDTATLDEDVATDGNPPSPAIQGDQTSASATIRDVRPVTVRTEMLKQTMPFQVKENREKHDQFYLRQKYQRTFVKPVRQLPTDEEKRKKLHILGQYFDLLPPDDSPVVSTDKNPSNPTNKQKRQSDKRKNKPGALNSTKELVPDTENANDTPQPESTSSENAPTTNQPSYQTLLETIEPELNVDDLVVALELRGVHLAKQTRMDLIDKLGDCLELELECLGRRFHLHMKEQDKAARRAKHDRHEKKLQGILVKTTMLWNELRILQEDIVRIENEEFTKSEREYLEMKMRINHAKQKIKRQAREGFHVENSGDNELLQLNSLTSRGAAQRFFNGDQALLDISVGSRHVLAVHQTGKLYAWGVGTFGRLGGVRNEHGDGQVPQRVTDDDIDAWHRDIHSPQRVGALGHLRFREVCSGFSHSLALTTKGEVYIWGSATHGKLGIGNVSASAKESFTLAPLPLHLPGRSMCCVRKIACGPSHSAILTIEGALFVWGSGDGGKLGLGDGRDIGEDCVPRNGGQLGVLETPVRVKALAKENCVDVSCGTAHTAVLTAIVVDSDGKLSGGRAFVAGSNHALGKFTPTFSPLHIPRVDEAVSTGDQATQVASTSIAISRVSCGNSHTALVSQDGELLTWGNNAGGCTGHPIAVPLVKIPTRVSCLYQYPRNLCLERGVRAYQSTQNASCSAEFALQAFERSVSSSNVSYSQTQQEMCPFWQVKLTAISRIERIVVAFKTPATSTTTSRTTQRSVGSGVGTTRPMSSASASSTLRSSRSAYGVNGTKFVVLISETPFDVEERGKYSVAKAKGHSIFSSFTLESEEDTVWNWLVPVDTYGKYVRVQVDNTVAMLSLSNVSVIGIHAEEFSGSRVSDVACTDGATVAICRPLSAHEMIRERFQRAIRADRNHLWVLQQLETFHPFVQEEIEVKRPTAQDGSKTKCVLCRPKERCVVCLLDDATFAAEIQMDLARKRKEREDKHREQLERERQRQEELLRQQKQLMRGSSTTVTQNKSRESARRKSVRDAKAKAEAEAKAKKAAGVQDDESEVDRLKRTLTLEDKCQRLLRLNMRTEAEEEEAERRLAAELFAIDPLAAAAAQAGKASHTLGVSNQAGDGTMAATSAKRFPLLQRLTSLLTSKRRGIPSLYRQPASPEHQASAAPT